MITSKMSIALVERGEDGTFGIFTPELKHSIIGEGKSVLEAKEDFFHSFLEMIISYTDGGKEIPDELKNISFEFKYDIASFFDYYDYLNMSGFAKKAGINPSLLRQYKSGSAKYISEIQMKKIEGALHTIIGELNKAAFII